MDDEKEPGVLVAFTENLRPTHVHSIGNRNGELNGKENVT